MGIFEKFNEIEGKVQKAISEQPALEAERNIVKREVSKKITELKELGITFESKEDLENTYKEVESNLELSLQSLQRKLEEYEALKEELDNVETKIENMEVY